MLDYTNTTPELLNEVNAIFNKEIDPIFMDLAVKSNRALRIRAICRGFLHIR